jgi:hypothetical protein
MASLMATMTVPPHALAAILLTLPRRGALAGLAAEVAEMVTHLMAVMAPG